MVAAYRDVATGLGPSGLGFPPEIEDITPDGAQIYRSRFGSVAQYNPRWAILTWLLLLVPLDRWLPPQGPGPTPVEQHSG
jgi:hypothetical protein